VPSQGERKSKVRNSCTSGPARRHTLLFVVVAHFDVAGQREVLAQRMTVKTIIGQDAAQSGWPENRMP
jgi:hypothetical protein